MPQPPARQKLRRRPQQRRVDVVHRSHDLHAIQRRERPQQRTRLGRPKRGRVHVVYDQDETPSSSSSRRPLPRLFLPRRGGRRGGGGRAAAREEMRDALYALWRAWQTRERGDDIPRRERGQKPIEDEDVRRWRQMRMTVPGGSTSACKVVERVALRPEAVEDEVEAFCELEEVARQVIAVVVSRF